MITLTENLNTVLIAQSKKLLIIDYDGALTKAHANPEDAFLTVQDEKKLQLLALRKDLRLVVMTGRSRASIDMLIGHLNIDIIAEHGAFYKRKGIWRTLIEDDGAWKNSLFPILVEYSIKCSGAVVEEKEMSLCWHYRKSSKKDGKNYAEQLTYELESHLKKFNLRIIYGKKVVEFLPAHMNKGRIARMLMYEDNFEHVFTVGDEITHDEISQALAPYKQCHTIKVGDGNTRARYRLSDEKDVWSLLTRLNQ